MGARQFQVEPKKQYALSRNFIALGNYLHEMRVKANLTQREVSLALGYSAAQFISNFERGIAAPPLKKLKLLMEMYKMPVDKVMALILEGEKEALRAELKPENGKTKKKRG